MTTQLPPIIENVVDVGDGIQLCFDEWGDRQGQTVMLIPGLGQQLHAWPYPIVTALVDRGYHVIRVDNRDVGLSTHMGYPAPSPLAMLRGGNHHKQYDLRDMARDLIGLLDAAGIRRAHLVGMSMGAMIAQTAAAQFPGRVSTLTSIMSTTGARGVGRPAASTWLRMATIRPPRTSRQAVESTLRMFRHIGSRDHHLDKTRLANYAEIAFARDRRQDGVRRQLAAIFRSGDRTDSLNHVVAPTLVIHGDHDVMVNPTGATATVEAIAGARLEIIAGMGHDLPQQIWDRLVFLIGDHVSR